jgi:cyclic 2,3-diphosphoglycerate synthetase
VIARAVARLRAEGENPVLALLVGGGEKLGQRPLDVGVPVEVSEDPEAALAAALPRTGAGRVIDLSDEPVLGYLPRCRLASVALWRGAEYVGADFAFTPPPARLKPAVPSVAVIGTGKRTGKTAIGGMTARTLNEAGLRPIVVAMGRGGPAEPEVIEAGARIDPRRLLRFVEEGRHAASDYIEDALTSGVGTVGAWRAGGGMAGGIAHTNFEAALRRAEALDPGILVLEGSGAAMPPARFDAAVLVVNAGINPEYLCGYFGLYRLLLSDVVVLTMCERSLDSQQIAAVERCVRRRPLNEPEVVRTVFRPSPLGDISGKKIWFVTTANEQAGPVLRQHLERNCGARVVGVSHALANRERLRRELEDTGGAEALVVELKAAAVDVVTRFGLEHGLEVVYVDNRAETVGGDGDLEKLLMTTASRAQDRFRA